MVRANDDNTDSPEATSDTNKKKREPGRLTPMPDWLMHWWTPLLLAGILLAAGCFLASIWRMPLRPVSWWKINLYWPPSWPFNYHWPSKDAMALCATIAGAGFAFSAWQQRSHDNAVRDDDKLDRERAAAQARAEREEQRGLEETRRLEQIERDEYWKRREQIFQILASNNPGLRLGAVALLAELADKAEDSSLLNDTEKQQLQRHIIDTLCLQLRHEGLNQTPEGTRDEHAEIQNAILQVILERIQNKRTEQVRADWSQETIDLSNSHFATDLYIDGVTSTSTIKLNGSHFQNGLGIFGAKLGIIDLNSCIFDKYLYIGNKEKPVTLHCEAITITSNCNTRFENTTFITDSEELFTSFETKRHEKNILITLEACKFYNQECKCPATCSCKSKTSTGTCQCLERQDCYCSSTCINTTIKTVIPESRFENNTNRYTLMFSESKIRSIELWFNYRDHPSIQLSGNTFTDELKFYMTDTDSKNTIPNTHRCIENNPAQSPTITVKENTFITIPERAPISINITTQQETRPPFKFSSNFLISATDYSTNIPAPNEVSLLLSSRPQKYQLLVCKADNAEPERYHFSAHTNGSTAPVITPWDSGRFCPPNCNYKQERYSQSLACSCVDSRNVFTIIEATDDTSLYSFISTVRQLIIEQFISLGSNFGWPGIEYTLNDVDIKQCYFVLDDTGPQALFRLTPGDEDLYHNYDLSWNFSSQFDRIQCISTFERQGIIQRIFDYAAEHSDYLRCDTYEGDHAMRHALEVFGFQECGTFTAEDGRTRVAYDWIKELEPQD